jgi:pSer/pThr/pTyr-binding forkhead associated (FHA) protein
MPARLVPLNPGPAPAIPIQRPVLLVGRHPECDVRIDLPKVSRRHCCVALVYDRVMIRDLGSRNGLRVNGRVVEEVQLRPGDEVAIGPLLYRLEDPDAVAAPAPSAKASTPKNKSQSKGKKPTPADSPVDLPSLPDEYVNTSDDLFPVDL